MKRAFLRNLAVAVVLATLAANTCAWAAKAATKAVDPAAVTALNKMGAYLRSLKAFQVQATSQREVVLDDGLKVQYQGATNMITRKPDSLYVDASSDRQERHYFYNGKQFTLWAPRVNFYATVKAPPTIRELTDTLQEKYGIEMPLVDLFRWGTDAASSAGITAAVDIGPSKIGDTDCRHYAFRQQGLDWQIWIQKGNSPLPHKLVLTTTTDAARPQYQATYNWNLAPNFSNANFTFKPPAKAERIVFNVNAPKPILSKKGK